MQEEERVKKKNTRLREDRLVEDRIMLRSADFAIIENI